MHARPVVRLPAGSDFTSLALAPRALAWSTSAATYLASTATGSFVQVTPAYGYATGSSSVLLVTDAPAGKSAHAPLPTYVVNPATFSWPACAGLGPRPGGRPGRRERLELPGGRWHARAEGW